MATTTSYGDPILASRATEGWGVEAHDCLVLVHVEGVGGAFPGKNKRLTLNLKEKEVSFRGPKTVGQKKNNVELTLVRRLHLP